MRDNRGFTLIEVLVVSLIAVVIAGALIFILNSSRRSSHLAELDSQAQQNARVAIDFITKDLRSAGFGVDIGAGQGAIVHAGAYDVVFNANIEPEPDDAMSPGYPRAISVAASPARVPPSGTVLYAPSVTYGTGAETSRFTLDSSNDGAVDSGDDGDDEIEAATSNPTDYAAIKQVYGYDGTTNGGASEVFALLRGPDAYPDGTRPYPLFTYWYDDDDLTSTPDVMWGDTDGSGELEQGEIAALTDVPAADLHRINSIGIHAIGAARSPDSKYPANNGYRETVMTSEVGVRNEPLKSAYIRGTVYNDLNSNGAQDGGEAGLAGAILRLNTGLTRTTGSDGAYSFRVDGGTYTVTETDPVGYSSTTANAVMVDAVKGTVVEANYGDRAIAGYGTIAGKVILDENGDGILGGSEPGVDSVEIFLNTGDRDTTAGGGDYAFTVPVNPYSVTMTMPAGYLAVGPTTRDTTITTEGETVIVNFGLVVYTATGTLAGKVYIDADRDGALDMGETGLANVPIKLDSGDSTLTNTQGQYTFTIPPGTYDITEYDLGGYASTTPNHVTGVPVAEDSTSTVNFGDELASTLSFQVITLGETQRALCIASGDLKEKETGGDKNDPEIILGTKYVTGVSNLNVWKNNWVNASTPNSAIFDQAAWYSRSPSEDIFSVYVGDTNGDDNNDVISGLTSTSGRTLVWRTQTSGNNKGILPATPTSSFVAQGPPDVLSAVLYNVDADADKDAIIGTEYMTNQGRLEVWFNNGAGTYTHDNVLDVYTMAGAHVLGAARSIALGNLAGSAATDVVVGTATGTNTGKVEIFRDNGAPTGKYTHFKTINARGEVNAVVVADMLEDDDGDNDIIIGTKSGVGTGWVELWLNNGDGTFGDLDSTGAYAPSDTAFIEGEVLCIGVAKLDRDVYPDIIVGMKEAGSYVGEVQVFNCYGYMPSEPGWSSASVGNVGEVITLTINDFNKDTRQDFAVGTRTSLSRGTVVVFFNTTQ